mmetsp:Transcript_92964/g.268461  ORF Transcript_92964/g.268461 Transcript_92964/m.268461 type:complete len:283 (+) Transcript_92964:324-1172(+)
MPLLRMRVPHSGAPWMRRMSPVDIVWRHKRSSTAPRTKRRHEWPMSLVLPTLWRMRRTRSPRSSRLGPRLARPPKDPRRITSKQQDVLSTRIVSIPRSASVWRRRSLRRRSGWRGEQSRTSPRDLSAARSTSSCWRECAIGSVALRGTRRKSGSWRHRRRWTARATCCRHWPRGGADPRGRRRADLGGRSLRTTPELRRPRRRGLLPDPWRRQCRRRTSPQAARAAAPAPPAARSAATGSPARPWPPRADDGRAPSGGGPPGLPPPRPAHRAAVVPPSPGRR